MPKYPLVGPSSVSRSLAAAASELTNLYAEIIANPDDRAKNTANLYLTPGRHVFKDVTSIVGAGRNVRGIWSGGGDRLFVVVGSYVIELDSAANVVGSPYNLVVDNDKPVQFFGNGNQLGLIYTYTIPGPPAVESGAFLINNGSGWVAARFMLTGQVTVAGTAVHLVKGDAFTPEMVNLVITIDDQNMVVTGAAPTATDLTLTAAMPGTGTGTVTSVSFGPGLGGWVSWVSGDIFTQAMNGKPITIDGLIYTIDFVFNDGTGHTLQILGDIPTHAVAVAYSVAQTTAVTYRCAGGAVVDAITGAFVDGAFHVMRPPSVGNGAQINFSAPFDGTDWDGLDFYSKEGAADHLRSIIADGTIIYALGTDSSEAFQNNPSTGLPQRIPGALVKYGTISHWAPQIVGGKLYTVGGDSEGGPVAYRFDSYIPTRISTHAEEAHWLKLGFGLDCVSYSYMEEGHSFFCINFGAETWMWDETSKVWGRRMGWDGANFVAHGTKFHTYIVSWGNGKHIVGGTGSIIYEQSASFYDESGADMAWQRAVPYRYNAGNFIYFGRMTLEMETGTVASGAAPVVTRDYSDDRGKTFTNPRDASMGVHDDNSIRMYWLRNGKSRGRVWRFFGKGQEKVAIIDLECDEILGTT